MNGLYLGCTLARSTTVGDCLTAFCCGIALGLLPWLFL